MKKFMAKPEAEHMKKWNNPKPRAFAETAQAIEIQVKLNFSSASSEKAQ